MTAFNKSRPKPKWLTVKPSDSKHSKRRLVWYNKLWDRQPPWADTKKIHAIYRQAKQMRADGLDVEVDHIYPLNGRYSSGLHVHYNLRIIDKKINAWLSNHRQEHSPQHDLFDNTIAPPDWELKVQ